MNNERIGNWAQTLSGEKVWIIDHRKGDINETLVRDAVYAISGMPRFGGHVRPRYYVGQHCLELSQVVSPKNALWALIHDLHEGMAWVDVPHPLKEHIPPYKALEESFAEVVADYFGLEWPMPQEVKEMDRRMSVTEGMQLMHKISWGGTGSIEPIGRLLHPLTPNQVEGLWWYRFEELGGKLK